MSQLFDKDLIKVSPYPSDFIPSGAVIFTGFDESEVGGDCTVKGFYKDGEYHIQSVEHREVNTQKPTTANN